MIGTQEVGLDNNEQDRYGLQYMQKSNLAGIPLRCLNVSGCSVEFLYETA